MTRNLSKPIVAALLLGALSACGTKEKLPLLEGRFANVLEPTELTLVYDYDGDIYATDIVTDSSGVFRFDEELPADAVDCIIYAGHSIYGAYLENGKTVNMDINGETAEFTGDNTELNEFMNAYQQAFSIWKFKPTPGNPFNYEEYTDRLEKNTLNARQYLAQITDNTARENYGKMVDGYNNYYRLQFSAMNGEKDSEATKAIIDSVDPNADYARLTGLLNYWYNSAPFRQKGTFSDATQVFIDEFAMIDSALTNEANKKSLYRTMGNFFMSMVRDEAEIDRFFKGVDAQMQKAPLVKAEFQKVLDERAKEIKDGSELPSNPVLIDINGNKTDLKTELQGKVAYIDLWATWCGPCCREIPFMEKLAEKYAGNDKIRIISISEDDETEAWEEKIKNDKPAWPNFIFDKKTGREFLDAINCHAIPRFLLIGADGRFIAVSAPRPSDKNIEEILNSAIGE